MRLRIRHGHAAWSVLRRDRVRRDIGIQRLPDERHPLGQPILVEGTGGHLPAERLHSAMKSRGRLLCRAIHAAQHRGVVKHMRQRAIRADQERTREKSRETELGLDLGERRKEVHHTRETFGRRRPRIE